MSDIFINYRTDDEASAATVIERELARRFGPERVFRDSTSMRAGEQFAKRLLGAVHGSRALLAVIGRRWQEGRDPDGRSPLEDENDWVRRELLAAKEYGVRVIPVLVDGAPRLDRVPLPPELVWLRHVQYWQFRNVDSAADLARLAAELADLLPGLEDRTTAGREPPAAIEVTARDVRGGMINNIGNHGNVHGGNGTQINGSVHHFGPGTR